MKTTFYISTLILVIASKLSILWALIEFILYLVNKTPFNWWSIYSFVISVVLAILINVVAAFVAVKQERKKFTRGK